MDPTPKKSGLPLWAKLLICAVILFFSQYTVLIALLMAMEPRMSKLLCILSGVGLPAMAIALVFFYKKKRFVKYTCIGLVLFVLAFAGNMLWISYDDSLIVNTSPSINTRDYLPFQEGSLIARLEEPSALKLEGDLPIVDGAAAVFPVYSAFVNAAYPETTELYDGVFEYNNTVGGYAALADRQTDIFFGAYPSQEQLDYAAQQGTEFVFTPIGSEAFVFFVHKDNPVDSLTTEQIQKIYTGEITNWKQVGGNNEPITAYQRNEGSGSQSMLLRFMGGKMPMEPDTENVVGGMLDIIETVAQYRSKPGSIGFSFRFYVEGIIKNPDIKLISIDGVAPTVENIQNGSYPVTTPLYAVTWKGNPKENVQRLLDWILSEQGQYLIEETGYVPQQPQPFDKKYSIQAVPVLTTGAVFVIIIRCEKYEKCDWM